MTSNFWRRYGPTIAWATLLFGLSSIPDLSSPVHFSSWDDKFEHTLAYMPLGWLLMRSLTWNGRNRRTALWLTIIIGTLYGVSDEIHQYFIPGRFMDWGDALADSVGVALGGGFFCRWRKRKSSSEKESTTKSERKAAPATRVS
jgi:VanZ family protein